MGFLKVPCKKIQILATSEVNSNLKWKLGKFFFRSNLTNMVKANISCYQWSYFWAWRNMIHSITPSCTSHFTPNACQLTELHSHKLHSYKLHSYKGAHRRMTLAQFSDSFQWLSLSFSFFGKRDLYLQILTQLSTVVPVYFKISSHKVISLQLIKINEKKISSHR